MKQIVIRELRLRKFKGVTHLDVAFNEGRTTVSGGNGTGKTTIADAFHWLLFGKNSKGQTDFEIKTYDENGDIMHRLEHSVEGVFSVNGSSLTLRRVYSEKWVKPRGQEQDQLAGHTTEYFINGVAVGTKKEYDAEVDGLCSEGVFRLITNPFHFASLLPAQQKHVLLSMVENVSDEYVTSLKPEFEELVEQMEGKSLATFKAEVSAKKKAIKKVIEEVPARIDTANSCMPQAENWAELAAELTEKTERLKEIDDKILDRSKTVSAQNEAKVAIQRQIGEKRLALGKVENDVRSANQATAHAAQSSAADLRNRILRARENVAVRRNAVNRLGPEIATLEAQLPPLREKYNTINAETLKYKDGEFECPTCGRPLELRDIEAKQAEMLRNFNEGKAKRLLDVSNEGKQKKADLEAKKKMLAEAEEQLKGSEAEVEGLENEAQQAMATVVESVDVDALIRENADWQALSNEIKQLTERLEAEGQPEDVQELLEGKNVTQDAIDELNRRIAVRGVIEKNQKLIDEINETNRVNNQELAALERMEFLAMDFEKTKDAELLERINKLFQIVRFSFVKEQLNGAENMSCECFVDGTPFNSKNSAGQVNAGLDIINALCKHNGVYAPILIDGAESVNEFIETKSQMILLAVTKDQQLTIQ